MESPGSFTEDDEGNEVGILHPFVSSVTSCKNRFGGLVLNPWHPWNPWFNSSASLKFP
jgi:hypothetical protein